MQLWYIIKYIQPFQSPLLFVSFKTKKFCLTGAFQRNKYTVCPQGHGALLTGRGKSAGRDGGVKSSPNKAKTLPSFRSMMCKRVCTQVMMSFWIQHSPSVDRQGFCQAMATTIPDLTPLDFYLWDYVKQHVYSERINDINHLKQRITDVIHSVTPDILNRVWEELEYCLDACRATNGSHIELH